MGLPVAPFLLEKAKPIAKNVLYNFGEIMKFARYTFLIAGIYGLLVLLPNYFAEASVGRDYPPAITHSEFFYGFVGIAIVFQIVFLIISTDPVKYRLMIIPAILEKLSFGIPALILQCQGRMPLPWFIGGLIDLILCTLFVISFIKVPRTNAD